ncbi:MAG: tRNA pseudouridine(55) synthase TruB [Candidatus Hydrogenedentota bacterium]
MNGILLVDKPAGMTSHDVVDRIRKAAQMRKVGHTGTLDPAATGLLILCLGAATRLSDYLVGMDKTYAGEMTFGVVSDSYDADGTVLEENEVPEIDSEQLRAEFAEFTGTFDQIPPMVSAVKVGGQRLYKLARQGETVERPSRSVTVPRFELESLSPPKATFSLDCTSGTYVRSLCHDIGQRVGCGAILSSLRRTRIGRHDVSNALELDQFQNPEDVQARLLDMGDVLDLPSVTANNDGQRLVCSGNQINPSHLLESPPEEPGCVQIKSRNGHLLALADLENRATGTWIQPRKVFPVEE